MLHIVINNIGKIINIKMTKSHVDSRAPMIEKNSIEKLKNSVYNNYSYNKANLFRIYTNEP